MGAKSSVATERRPSAPRGKRRSFSVGRKGTESQSAWVPPSPEEATLVQRLAPGTSPREGPPYYAIAESWLSIWRVFALEGGIRPGPIENDKLLNTSRSQDICWLSAADWHSLYGRYGGGPILCRHTKQLFVSTQPVNAGEGEMPASVRATSSRGLLEELSPRSGSASSSSPEALLRKACNALTWKCRDIETSLRDEVERLENGPWRAKTPKAQAPKVQTSKAIVAARQRVCQAVKATCGGEELKSALQDLASLNREDPELRGLEAKVYDLCSHEEAQIVLVILLQAVQEADRLGLEMWLEEARGVELLVGNMDIYEPLRKTLSELEEREKRALAGHAATTENEEEPAERLWRQVQFAVEANDEDTLMMLIEEAQERGIDASVAWMAWEELRHRREEAEGHSTIPPPPRPRAGTSSPSGQPRADDARHKSRGTIPGNAPRRGSAWHQQQEDIDDDFLNRYKKWRADQRAEREAGQSSYRPFSQADREGESEAEASRARVEAERKRVREAEARRRQEREEEEEERRRQEDEESKRRAAFEAEREQRRRRQRFDHTTPPSGQPQNRGFAPSAQAQRQDGQGRAKSLTDEMEAQLRQTRYQPLETRKRIFKDLQLRLHPDKNPDNPQAAKTAFQALMEKRQEYLAP